MAKKSKFGKPISRQKQEEKKLKEQKKRLLLDIENAITALQNYRMDEREDKEAKPEYVTFHLSNTEYKIYNEEKALDKFRKAVKSKAPLKVKEDVVPKYAQTNLNRSYLDYVGIKGDIKYRENGSAGYPYPNYKEGSNLNWWYPKSEW